ncbi:hypothetical protein MSM1_10025 [Mycobacterium sp. SM1]|uniref:hypothetical protein n=1 Tax=Mycobacterium sp. SM1 TaxID=2816243 RepID=UPI001BCCFA6D|nr:hypothetical protein [Mycobacterium sp. SM1]MBS4728655.1 hypothetical protein [Mycobacterium sp. SM1]
MASATPHDLHRQGVMPCKQVIAVLDQQVRDIDQTIAALGALRARLVAALQTAHGDQRPSGQATTVCRIIESAADCAASAGHERKRASTRRPGHSH